MPVCEASKEFNGGSGFKSFGGIELVIATR